MKSILTKIQILSFLCALPALANDVGLHNSSAQPTQANSAQQQKIPKITLEQPWIVPNDPGYSYQPGRFAENLESAACSELLQGYKFKSLRWTSPTCKVVEIVTPPKHGTLINEVNDVYGYKPVSDYLGKDSVQYIVEGVDGRRVLITLPIAVQTLAEAFSYNKPSLDSWSTKRRNQQTMLGFTTVQPNLRAAGGGAVIALRAGNG